MDIGTKIYPAMFPMPEIRKGCGSVQQLPEILRSYGVHSPMIVTGPTISKTIVPPIVEMLADQGFACTVFDQTEANPSVTTVEKIRDLYRERGCDGFLAICGGSPMDVAKIAAAAIAKPGQPIQKMAGMMRILAKVAPIIRVPTTAGTGSEVTIGAVISDHDTHHKYAITDPCVTPKAAILDPELTVSMPPFIAAIRVLNMRLGLPTGFDFIRQSDYETIAKWALEETNVNYPVPVLYDKVRLEHVLNRIILEA